MWMKFLWVLRTIKDNYYYEVCSSLILEIREIKRTHILSSYRMPYH